MQEPCKGGKLQRPRAYGGNEREPLLNVGLHGRREEMWACFMQGRRLKARSYRAIRRWTTRGRKMEASRPKLGVEWKTGLVGMWLGLGLEPTNKTTTKKTENNNI